MQRLFEQDFCEKSANIEFPLSVEDKLFLNKVGGSVTKLNGHYQIALPRRRLSNDGSSVRSQIISCMAKLSLA